MQIPFRSPRVASPPAPALPPWLRRVGLVNDYVRIPYANGSSFASQLLYRELRALGVDVTVIGPADPTEEAGAMPERHISLASVPLRNHPGVHLAMPSRRGLSELERGGFDLVLAQTCTGLMDAGTWLRARRSVPFVAVNTVHLPSVYNTLLPDWLDARPSVHRVFRDGLVPFAEARTVSAYNQGDGLVVLSSGLARYWRERGVRVPIHVIPRAIDRTIFDARVRNDPFSPRAERGGRLLVVCRHVREKGVARLLRLVAAHVFPRRPDATLTLVGDGPDHDAFRSLATSLGIADRTFFEGERALDEMPSYYRHADVFVYTSLSETYGQVVSEAAYSGVPVVAFDDAMGVHDQVEHGVTGLLVPPGPDGAEADRAFGAALLSLLDDAPMRRALGARGAERTRARTSVATCVDRYLSAFEDARAHVRRARDPRGLQPELTSIARWSAVHSLVAALGVMRPPATLNRRGVAAPPWDGGPRRRSEPRGAR